VSARASLLKTEVMAAVCWAWCFPSFLCYGLVAGEAVKLRRAPSFSFASLAGRGGEGRSWGWKVARFCCRWFWVVSSAGFAPAGRGGEGSSFWRWVPGGAGGPERHGGGWKKGGGGRVALWPCSFSEFRFRRWAADGSCGCLQLLLALPLGGLRYGVAGGA
jgi:hypothetical protein